MITMKDLDRLSYALDSEELPCNPRPFALAIAEATRNIGSAWIKTDEAKRILWVLLAQSYGETETIDIEEEWCRLTEDNRRNIINEETTDLD